MVKIHKSKLVAVTLQNNDVLHVAIHSCTVLPELTALDLFATLVYLPINVL